MSDRDDEQDRDADEERDRGAERSNGTLLDEEFRERVDEASSTEYSEVRDEAETDPADVLDPEAQAGIEEDNVGQTIAALDEDSESGSVDRGTETGPDESPSAGKRPPLDRLDGSTDAPFEDIDDRESSPEEVLDAEDTPEQVDDVEALLDDVASTELNESPPDLFDGSDRGDDDEDEEERAEGTEADRSDGADDSEGEQAEGDGEETEDEQEESEGESPDF